MFSPEDILVATLPYRPCFPELIFMLWADVAGEHQYVRNVLLYDTECVAKICCTICFPRRRRRKKTFLGCTPRFVLRFCEITPIFEPSHLLHKPRKCILLVNSWLQPAWRENCKASYTPILKTIMLYFDPRLRKVQINWANCLFKSGFKDHITLDQD